jgi:hypothetical protein
MAQRGRPPKVFSYHADGETIRSFFARYRELEAAKKATRETVKALNKQADAGGVHPRTLRFVLGLAAMPPGRRGWCVALLRRYLDILATELHDADVPVLEEPAETLAETAPAETAPAPNGSNHNLPSCDYCGETFTPVSEQQRYCSSECKRQARNAKRQGGVTVPGETSPFAKIFQT